MSKRKNLIVLLIVLIAMLAAYCGISAYSDYAAQKKEEREQEESEQNRIWITNFDEVKEISYDNGTAQLSFVKEDDEWKYKELTDFPLTQSYLTKIEDTVSHLEASRRLEGGDELKDYGLDEPQATVTVTDDAGNTVTLEIGDSVNSEYYLLVEGEDVPYTVASTLYSNIQYDLYDMIEMEEFPDLSEDNILAVEVSNETGSYVLEKREVETATAADATAADAAAEPDENQEETSEEETEAEPEYEWYLSQDGKRSKVENESMMDDLLDDLENLAFEECENYKGSEEELKNAGLSKSETTFTVIYIDEDGEEAHFTVLIGEKKPSEEEGGDTKLYYARFDDSKAINLMKEDLVMSITGSEADDYLESEETE
ncbi:MAG: DUF4340 domain-containing protein [Lachnospiraceae bacterium]|nr:DUF4340 domain-containing protein [Lachnospiraceae bacterium]